MRQACQDFGDKTARVFFCCRPLRFRRLCASICANEQSNSIPEDKTMNESANNDRGRRTFLKGAASAGLMTAASYEKILGANDRVRAGFIGIGRIGKRHL